MNGVLNRIELNGTMVWEWNKMIVFFLRQWTCGGLGEKLKIKFSFNQTNTQANYVLIDS